MISRIPKQAQKPAKIVYQALDNGQVLFYDKFSGAKLLNVVYGSRVEIGMWFPNKNDRRFVLDAITDERLNLTVCPYGNESLKFGTSSLVNLTKGLTRVGTGWRITFPPYEADGVKYVVKLATEYTDGAFTVLECLVRDGEEIVIPVWATEDTQIFGFLATLLIQPSCPIKDICPACPVENLKEPIKDICACQADAVADDDDSAEGGDDGDDDVPTICGAELAN